MLSKLIWRRCFVIVTVSTYTKPASSYLNSLLSTMWEIIKLQRSNCLKFRHKTYFWISSQAITNHILFIFIFTLITAEAYSEPSQTSKMDHFAKIVNNFQELY